MVAMQLAAEPLVRQAVRQVFQTRAVLSVKPTKKGKKARKIVVLYCTCCYTYMYMYVNFHPTRVFLFHVDSMHTCIHTCTKYVYNVYMYIHDIYMYTCIHVIHCTCIIYMYSTCNAHVHVLTVMWCMSDFVKSQLNMYKCIHVYTCTSTTCTYTLNLCCSDDR